MRAVGLPALRNPYVARREHHGDEHHDGCFDRAILRAAAGIQRASRGQAVTVRIIHGDCRDVLPTLLADSFDCCVTSPPYYGLRDYGVEGQIGLEPTMQEYLETMVGVCREIKRVLKPSGTFWLNVGDSYAHSGRGGNPDGNTKQSTNAGSQGVGVLYGLSEQDREAERARMRKQFDAQRAAGLKPKDLCMIPNRLAIALQEDGWFVRSEIIWHKLNPMPESVADRPTCAHEKVWLLTKNARYWYDADAIAENTEWPVGSASDVKQGGFKGKGKDCGSQASFRAIRDKRNARNVWSIASKPYSGTHFAIMPPALAERCIKAGCPAGGHVLDPFGGAGTTGLVADRLARDATLIELNPSYRELARGRVSDDAPLFVEVDA